MSICRSLRHDGLLYIFSPWCADDFSYWPGPEFSLASILRAEWQQYMDWGGRSVAHLIVRGLLLSNQWTHCLLTPLVFVGILCIGQMLLWGKAWRERALWWHPVLLFMLFWLYIPNFGQAIFWRTGAGNYCWTSFFALLFLVPFRFLLDDPFLRPTRGQTFLLALLGLCAGWSNENVGIVIFLASAASVAHTRWKSGKWPLWAVLCCGMSLTGWLLLILAPGNYVRLQVVSRNYQETSIVKKLISYYDFWIGAQHHFIPLYILMIVGMVSWKRQSKISFFIVLCLFIMAQMTLGAFLLSVIPAPRALTMTNILICISASFFLYETSISIKVRKICIITLSFLGISSIIIFIPHFYKQISIMQKRDKLIISSCTPIIPAYIHTNSRYFYPETLDDFNTWVKKSFLHYYNLKDITIENQDINKEMIYIINGEKLVFKQNKNYTINIAIENSKNSNNQYIIYYIPYITSLEKLLNFSLISLYELFREYPV